DVLDVLGLFAGSPDEAGEVDPGAVAGEGRGAVEHRPRRHLGDTAAVGAGDEDVLGRFGAGGGAGEDDPAAVPGGLDFGVGRVRGQLPQALPVRLRGPDPAPGAGIA